MDEIGSYSVVRRLDPGGGLGTEAYLAVRSAPPGPAGLNVLVLVEVDAATRARAAHSLAAVSNLDHPATAPVLDDFEHDGKLVLVLEHHDGLRIEQIQERLHQDEERLTDLAVWQIAHQLLGALAEAHEASDPTGTPLGLAHGHLGPDVTHIGWDGRLRVLGMGLDRLFLDEDRSEAALAYRPPEHGSHGSAEPAGDLYAAGAIIWSLLTGRRPPSAGRAEPLAKTRNDLPRDLAEAIDLTLAASPAARRITARELVHRLEREIPNVLDLGELRWNIEIFRALSLFSPATPPPPSTRPIDFRPQARPRLISHYPAPEISEPPVTIEAPTIPRPTASDNASAPATKEDWPQRLDELDMPTVEPSTRRRPGLTGAADPGDEPRTHVMERPDFDAMKPPGSTLVSSSSDEPATGSPPGPAPATPVDHFLQHDPARPVRTPTLVSESAPLPLERAAATPSPALTAQTPAPAAPTPAPAPLPAPAPTTTGTITTPIEPAAPASLPISLPAGVPRRSLLPRLALAAVALAGGAVIGWFVLAGRNDEPAADAEATTTATAQARRSATPATTATASVRAAIPASASVAPPAAPPPSSAPFGDPGGDLSGLLSYEGYLVVASSAQADVYVQGVRVGVTNTRIKARCWRRFVRLKDPSSDAWLTAGQPVQIECMAVTTVPIEP